MRKRQAMVWLMAAGLLGSGTATNAEVLVDYDDGLDNGIHDKEISGGGFTGMTDYKFGPWILLSKAGGMKVLTSMPCDVGSAENTVACDIRVIALDTGHKIAAGDKFNLGFHWRDAQGWSSNATVEVVLYYTDNGQMDGTILGAIPLNTGRRKDLQKWEQVRSNNRVFDSDKAVGKRLFLRVHTRAPEKQYARIDNIFVEVVPAKPKATDAPTTMPATQPTSD